jgi:hypothetical protein
MTSDQIRGITASGLSAFTTDEIVSLSTDQVVGLSYTQLIDMATDRLAAFTATQTDAIATVLASTAQVSALQARGF